MNNKIISKAVSLLLSAAFICSSGNTVFAAVKDSEQGGGLLTVDSGNSDKALSAVDKLIESIKSEMDAAKTAPFKPAEGEYLSSGSKTAFDLKIADPTDADLDYSEGFGDPEKIKEIADKLGDAVDIYNFVKNAVHNEMYKGHKKNPFLTLAQTGGNDMDQAALLIALLRAKNIPARFIRSNVKITSQQALDLTGAADLETAKSILTVSYPGVVEYDYSKNGVTEKWIALLEHTWVEAYIPYTDYRGAGRKTGEGVWIQLDPSFKKVTAVRTEFDPEYDSDQKNMLAALQKISDSSSEMTGDDFQAPEKSEFTALGIVQTYEPYLPSSLPYEFVDLDTHKWKAEQFTAIKNEDKQSIALNINGKSALQDFPVADLEGNFIGIGYDPADENSRKILEETDDITKIDPAKVNLIPVISIGDKKYKSTLKCTLGELQKLDIIIKNDTNPTKIVAKTETFNKDIIAGSVYAVNVDLESVSSAECEIADKAYQEAINDHKTKSVISSDVFGKIAGYAGKEYFAFCDYKNQIHKGVDNVVSNRHLAIAVTGYELSAEYTEKSQSSWTNPFGIEIPDYDFDFEDDYSESDMPSDMAVSSVDYGNFKIDVLYDEVTTISLTGDKDAARYYNFATGMEASKLEGEIWADITKTDSLCISTVSVMNAAAEKGISPVYINSSCLSELSKYDLDEQTKKGVTNFANSGRFIILIPEMLKIGDWEGTAYIAADLETGAANYMISGGLAGGESPKMPKDQWDKIWTMNYFLSKITQEIGVFSMATSCINLGPAARSRNYGDIMAGVQKFGASAIVYNAGVKMEFDLYNWLDDYLENPGSDDVIYDLAEKTVNNIRTTEFAILGLITGYPELEKVIQVLTSVNTGEDLLLSLESGEDVPYNIFTMLWDLMGYFV